MSAQGGPKREAPKRDRAEDSSMNGQWIKVAAVGDVPEGEALAVEAGGIAVCLYNIAGRIYATQDSCTHEEASLAGGYIDGDCIECPLHQAVFHIATGEVREPPATENLRVYPVRIDNGDVLVEVPADK
jgi:nitrite reductase/ring-hydroxylating ferredoxin subunit